jgi:predicted transposase YbfD/YdcC
MKSPVSYFSHLTDPRVERTREHDSEDILVIVIASVVCGAESEYDMEEFGKAKEGWLKTFLRLPGGIPSHDTFNRVFSALDPEELEKGFVGRTEAVAGLSAGEVAAIDGKSMRGTREHGNKSIVHMVSAWAQKNHMAFGQVKVDEKSNEITAIPRLLEMFVLKSCIVTIDAMGCQTDIASKIIEKEADYMPALKGNQGNLPEQVEDSFRFLHPVSSDEQVDSGYGRVETRRCQVINDLSPIERSGRWKGLQCLVKVESVRYFKCSGKEEKDTRRYITSLKADAKLINSTVRFHRLI